MTSRTKKPQNKRPIWSIRYTTTKLFREDYINPVKRVFKDWVSASNRAVDIVNTGNHSIKQSLEIINAFSDAECKQHCQSKPVNDLINEYQGHRRAFYIYLAMLVGLTYYQLTIGPETIYTIICGATGIALFSVLLPLYSWRCWQARVGGNYPPHRFAAALLKNPLQLLP